MEPLWDFSFPCKPTQILEKFIRVVRISPEWSRRQSQATKVPKMLPKVSQKCPNMDKKKIFLLYKKKISSCTRTGAIPRTGAIVARGVCKARGVYKARMGWLCRDGLALPRWVDWVKQEVLLKKILKILKYLF